MFKYTGLLRFRQVEEGGLDRNSIYIFTVRIYRRLEHWHAKIIGWMIECSCMNMKVVKDEKSHSDRPYLTDDYFESLIIDLSDKRLMAHYDLVSILIDSATLDPLKPIKVEVSKDTYDTMVYFCRYIIGRKDFDLQKKALVVDPQDDEISYVYNYYQKLIEELQVRGIRLSGGSKGLLVCGALKLNLWEGNLQYNDNPSIPVSSKTTEIQLLALLMRHASVVPYEEIARELDLSGNPKQYLKTADEIKYIVRNIRKLLGMTGMSRDLVKSIIKANKKHGYRMYLVD